MHNSLITPEIISAGIAEDFGFIQKCLSYFPERAWSTDPNDGSTLLHKAAEWEAAEIGKTPLEEYGLNVNARRTDGKPHCILLRGWGV